ncbi:hypothetical protein [Synechococcus sp. LTW-R]|uniref:hypothetical protein n=1 Tax=Synechococcus sp. LTW-R TaxID=2751170 RepID=UPI0016237A02|nr:hypothetical protein H0O22_09190 [Synechococcus sp. LTW-R]
MAEAIGQIGGPPWQGSALVIEQHLIGVLDGRTVPNNRLIGEAKAHHPVALAAAHGNTQDIGDLIHHAHPAGVGGGVTEEALLHQHRRSRHRSAATHFHQRRAVQRGLDAGAANHGPRRNRRDGQNRQTSRENK